MIRRVLSVLILVMAACGPAVAQSTPDAAPPDAPASTLPTPDQDAIRHVVEGQLAAFQRDDSAGAYGYATPMIQQKFGDAANFMAMVKGAYPPVYRPRSVTFDKLIDTDAGPDQILTVIGPDGHAYTAHYIMEKQPNGAWMINGCYLTRGDDQNV
jgi:Domain of unknown function (DUF4864)